MSRRVIKEDSVAGYTRESFLEKDERLQTDAEWHGELLESIGSHQETLISLLGDINDHLQEISHRLENIASPIINQNTVHPPMSLGRLVFAWIMALIIACVVAAISA